MAIANSSSSYYKLIKISSTHTNTDRWIQAMSTDTHPNTDRHTHTNTNTYTHTHTHTRTHIHTHTHTHTYTHTHTTSKIRCWEINYQAKATVQSTRSW